MKILIEIDRGCITEITSDHQPCEVHIFDHDNRRDGGESYCQRDAEFVSSKELKKLIRDAERGYSV